ncbi:uncharacterized protein LOC128894957 isoform X2 [Hylaeus anthracinus]|uniref:uncharacterized protein LOC128894957 isoform X2 n=1 Tax=Hylaeus anthracinus TaxID=313031 RepID=UPI0023B8BB69|nr:uncharacterized protein LOC128894957 isoform X2 [Hylaeus anthracinus]
MGQAWCKEKTTKAQDSKSPLDRVFVRCAHRIYPSLKEEGSVLGGATQRVTSSEIGYAGSPPREVLTRGRSIDSVDRPFQPSDWVDVNLEVPSSPRPSSVLTNLTVDTSLYPAATPASSYSNLKDSTPVPPPRRRKRNKGRPLPPKPDEIAGNSTSNSRHTEGADEPLYSSVQSPKSSGDEQDVEEEIESEKRCLQDTGRKTKEIYEHKVNGTGRIITSDMVSGKRPGRTIDASYHQLKPQDSEEYERFARNRTSKDSSTPNREDKRGSRKPENRVMDSLKVPGLSTGARTKNYSTVSLPNYDELDTTRHQEDGTRGYQAEEEKTKPRRPVRSSTGSLPAASFLEPFSEKTSVRLEDYISGRAIPDNLSPYQVLEKLECGENGDAGAGFVKYDPSKSEDWVLGGIGDCELNHQRGVSLEDASRTDEGEQHREDEDVVDSSGLDSRRRQQRDAADSSTYLQKPEAFGKTPSAVTGEPEHPEVDPNRSQLKQFDPPTLADSCRISANRDCLGTKEPFFLDEAKHRSALDTIGNPHFPEEDDRRSRRIFGRSLSNESEPDEDACESKELTSRPVSLVRTISEESLPREMLEQQELEELFDEKLAKDVHNKLKKSLDDQKTKTPPPSPEPRMKTDFSDGDHSTLLKVLKEETAEESNLSSMTPSLTELEAALSDMLEKEESQDVKDEARTNGISELVSNSGILTAEKNLAYPRKSEINQSVEATGNPVDLPDERNQTPVSLGQILEDRKPIATRKVSFCAWEETVDEIETRANREFIEDLDKTVVSRLNDDSGWASTGQHVDIPPEKPTRLNRTTEDPVAGTGIVPTPPRRRNKSLGAAKRVIEAAQNGSVIADPYANDRLI